MIYLDILTARFYISMANGFLVVARWASRIARVLAESADRCLARWDE